MTGGGVYGTGRWDAWCHRSDTCFSYRRYRLEWIGDLSVWNLPNGSPHIFRGSRPPDGRSNVGFISPLSPGSESRSDGRITIRVGLAFLIVLTDAECLLLEQNEVLSTRGFWKCNGAFRNVAVVTSDYTHRGKMLRPSQNLNWILV